MRSFLFILSIFIFPPFIYGERNYKIAVDRFGDQPIISYSKGSFLSKHNDPSLYSYNNQIGVIFSNDFSLYNSELNLSEYSLPKALHQPCEDDILPFSKVTSVDYKWYQVPRVTFFNNVYYLFYNYAKDYQGFVHALKLAKNMTPLKLTSWTSFSNPIIPRSSLTLGSALWATPNNNLSQHFFYYSDDFNISYICGSTPYDWAKNSTVSFGTREEKFDSLFISIGPSPVQLKNGDFLFIYNAVNYAKAGQVGWAILNATNPGQVLYRSDLPIMSPVKTWENTKVKITGMIPDPFGCPKNVSEIIGTNYAENAECFFGVYTGGDNDTEYYISIGAVRIISSWIELNQTTTSMPQKIFLMFNNFTLTALVFLFLIVVILIFLFGNYTKAKKHVSKNKIIDIKRMSETSKTRMIS